MTNSGWFLQVQSSRVGADKSLAGGIQPILWQKRGLQLCKRSISLLACSLHGQTGGISTAEPGGTSLAGLGSPAQTGSR